MWYSLTKLTKELFNPIYCCTATLHNVRALLKLLAKKRKDLRLVVMSATLETQKFASYLNTPSIFQVSGRTFPIDVYTSAQPISDYIEATVDAILQIHFEEADGDILAFLPGQEDIEDVQ